MVKAHLKGAKGALQDQGLGIRVGILVKTTISIFKTERRGELTSSRDLGILIEIWILPKMTPWRMAYRESLKRWLRILSKEWLCLLLLFILCWGNSL
jgi:hypothetical protein